VSTRGQVIWVTGLSGCGKTTLCDALHALLKPRMPHLIKLDGDEIRAAFGNDLGYAESERKKQIGRIQRIAKMLADQGLVVLVAALYSHPDLLAWNRMNLPGYFEVYLRAGLEFLAKRDLKELYLKSRRGEIEDVVGVDIPWHAPQNADLIIDSEMQKRPDLLAVDVVRAIPDMAAVLPFEVSSS
jgi:adenylyl-sulfate kinase